MCLEVRIVLSSLDKVLLAATWSITALVVHVNDGIHHGNWIRWKGRWGKLRLVTSFWLNEWALWSLQEFLSWARLTHITVSFSLDIMIPTAVSHFEVCLKLHCSIGILATIVHRSGKSMLLLCIAVPWRDQIISLCKSTTRKAFLFHPSFWCVWPNRILKVSWGNSYRTNWICTGIWHQSVVTFWVWWDWEELHWGAVCHQVPALRHWMQCLCWLTPSAVD